MSVGRCGRAAVTARERSEPAGDNGLGRSLALPDVRVRFAQAACGKRTLRNGPLHSAVIRANCPTIHGGIGTANLSRSARTSAGKNEGETKQG